MRIDHYLPRFDATEIHSIAIAAPPAAVWETLRHGDVAGSWIIKLLMGLRTMFSGIRRGVPRAITLDRLTGNGFGILEEDAPREVVIGVTGKFWRPTGNLQPFDRASYEQPVPPGFARGVWNFSLEETARGTALRTETRVLCGDALSRRKFRLYWTFVRPFSGLIRIVMLRAIRRQVARAGW